MKKKRPFVPRGRWLHLLSRLVLPTGTKGPLLSRLPDPGQKGTPFVPAWWSWLGNRDNRVSQPEQISVSVVVNVLKDTLGNERSITYIRSQMRETKWKAGFIQSPQGVLNPPN